MKDKPNWEGIAEAVREKQERGLYWQSPVSQGKEVSIVGEGLSFPKKTPEEIERERRLWAAVNSNEPITPTNYIRTQPSTAIPYCYREPHDNDAVIIHVGENSERCSYITPSVGIFYNAVGEVTGGRVDKAQPVLDTINEWWPEFNGVFEVNYLLWSHSFKAKSHGNIEELNALARKCRDAKLMVRHKPSVGEIAFGYVEFTREEAEQVLKENVEYFNNLNRVPQ